MKRIAFALVFWMAAAAAAVGQEKTDTTATKPIDSPLVRAAKASGGPKRKPKKKVITNADVKKSTGKLIVLPGKPGTAAPAHADAEPPKGPIERQDAQLRAHKAAVEQVAAAEKKVSGLEEEVRRLEDAYYAENDPNYRDTTIAARFNQAKRQLDDARHTLADARDAQEKVDRKTQ